MNTDQQQAVRLDELIDEKTGRDGVDNIVRSLERIPQGLFRLFAAGDVAQINDDSSIFDLLQVVGTHFDIVNAAILAAMPGFETVLAPGDDFADSTLDLFRGFVGIQIGHGHGQQLRSGIAAHPAIRFVYLQQTAARIGYPEAVDVCPEHGQISVLTLWKRSVLSGMVCHGMTHREN